MSDINTSIIGFLHVCRPVRRALSLVRARSQYSNTLRSRSEVTPFPRHTPGASSTHSRWRVGGAMLPFNYWCVFANAAMRAPLFRFRTYLVATSIDVC